VEDLFRRSSHLKYLSRAASYSEPMVFGKVKLWGKILDDGTVMRAQYAYPSTLYVPPEHEASAALAAKNYNIPIKVGQFKDVIVKEEMKT
jgi:hypothetical protein